MGIGLNAQQIKLVIDALRKGKPMKFSKLKKLQLPVQKGKIPKTIPTQSLTRYLHYLQLWGLVEQDKISKRWVWKQYIKRYNSETELTLHLEHSKKLSPTLKLILTGYVSPEVPRIKQTHAFRSFCEEHLETGYPELHKRLTELKELRERFEKLKEVYMEQLVEKGLALTRGPSVETSELKNRLRQLVKFEPESGILGFLATHGALETEIESYAVRIGLHPGILKELIADNKEFSGWFKVALETRNKIWEVFKELLGEFELIRYRIYMGTPLDGKCQTCPSFILAKSE